MSEFNPPTEVERAIFDREYAAATARLTELPAAGQVALLDDWLDARHITRETLARIARWDPTSRRATLAYVRPGSIQWRHLADLDSPQRGHAKLTGSRDEVIQVIHAASEPSSDVLVVEGQSDACWCLERYTGLDIAILPGARYATAEYLRPLRGYARVYAATDNDRDGDDAAARIAEYLPNVIRHAPPGKDWCESDDAPELPTEDELLPGRLASELLAEVPEEPNWLIPNVIAHGWMVKFAAREKCGKGSLVTHLLGRLEHGEATVFGPAHSDPVTCVIYTEEPEDSIREKVAAAGLTRARIIYGYELAKLTWPQKVAKLVAVAHAESHGIIFVDNISRAAGVTDENGVELARAGEALGEAAKAHGIAVILDHHHRKGGGKLEDKSRGGTALAGACDNNIEMERRGDWTSRERTLASRGRKTVTIWEKTIERTEDGTDYVETTRTNDWHLAVLAEFPDGATVEEYAAATELSHSTAHIRLEELRDRDEATREKVGRKYRYRVRTDVHNNDQTEVQI